jgi:class 3 adenylate cyclase/tetratricopeptide (TPR) repeat protein
MPSERRRVTVLFADLVGFSTLAEHLDPEELRGLINDTFVELTAEIEGRDGTVEKFIGDAVMAVFGAPRTHEDDPGRAVETALEMLATVERISLDMPTPLHLRIGVNSGLVVSGAVGDGTQAGILGDAVNTAARLQQAAAPDEVLVEASVWRRVRDRYEGEHVGLLEVKGREQPVDAYRIVGIRKEGEARRTPFVGRHEELALLELLWSSAAKGNTHVVSVVGEPGVGKSRLLAEFPGRRDALEARVTCGSERAFGPVLDLLERILGSAPTELEDLRSRTDPMVVDEETQMLLAAFFGLAQGPVVVRPGNDEQRRQAFAGVWQFLLGASLGRPALFVLDDVHWADRSSLELLGFLLERLAGVPLMLVLAYRPGFEHVERAVLRASHTVIRMELLSPQESVDVARGFLGVREIPSDLERLVVARAEGNPFFIEELLQALLEMGALSVEEGRVVLSRGDVEVPDTVQGMILARVDRLGPDERNLLQHAAIIGRVVPTDLLAAVSGAEDIRKSLEELAGTQLLVAHGPDRYSFKHALIQQVVYETLLLRRRRELHRKVAETLEGRAGTEPGALEVLAEHYARAEVRDKARQYALAAGDLAAERMGFVEAKARYETALRLWGEGDDEGRLELLMKLGYTAHLGGDPGEARTALVEAADGWRRFGDDRRAGAALSTLGRVYRVTGETERAVQVLREAVELLEPGGASPELVWAYASASTMNMLAGRIDEAMRLASRGLDMEAGLHMDGARSHLLNTLGVCEVFGGEDRGVERIREALALAESSRDAEAIGRGYTNLATTMWELCFNEDGLAICRRGREAMRHLGAPSFEWFIAGNEAQMLTELGRYSEAEELYRHVLGPERAVIGVDSIVNAGLPLVQLLTRTGRVEEARQTLDEVIPLARQVAGTELLVPVLVAEAELEEARGNLAAARQPLMEAVDMAMATPAVAHWFRVIVPASRLLPSEVVRDILDRASSKAAHPAFRARLMEAEGWLGKDTGRFQEAADAYASLGLPYEEARCRIEAGDPARASALIQTLGVEAGSLGPRLRATQAPDPAARA